MKTILPSLILLFIFSCSKDEVECEDSISHPLYDEAKWAFYMAHGTKEGKSENHDDPDSIFSSVLECCVMCDSIMEIPDTTLFFFSYRCKQSEINYIPFNADDNQFPYLFSFIGIALPHQKDVIRIPQYIKSTYSGDYYLMPSISPETKWAGEYEELNYSWERLPEFKKKWEQEFIEKNIDNMHPWVVQKAMEKGYLDEQ